MSWRCKALVHGAGSSLELDGAAFGQESRCAVFGRILSVVFDRNLSVAVLGWIQGVQFLAGFRVCSRCTVVVYRMVSVGVRELKEVMGMQERW